MFWIHGGNLSYSTILLDNSTLKTYRYVDDVPRHNEFKYVIFFYYQIGHSFFKEKN